jgi:hypothetical protein
MGHGARKSHEKVIAGKNAEPLGFDEAVSVGLVYP